MRIQKDKNQVQEKRLMEKVEEFRGEQNPAATGWSHAEEELRDTCCQMCGSCGELAEIISALTAFPVGGV